MDMLKYTSGLTCFCTFQRVFVCRLSNKLNKPCSGYINIVHFGTFLNNLKQRRPTHTQPSSHLIICPPTNTFINICIHTCLQINTKYDSRAKIVNVTLMRVFKRKSKKSTRTCNHL